MKYRFAAIMVWTLAISMPAAHADAIYVWQTLSATLHGQPTDLTAAGEIVLSDSGLTQGFGRVSSTFDDGTISHTLDGVVAASFQIFRGPTYTLNNSLVNFLGTVHDQFLDVTTMNPFGGFFVNVGDTDAYYAVPGPGPDVLTIGYGSDNPSSVCFGPQMPDRSACVVTGFFERIPEPGTLLILMTALGIFLGVMAKYRRFPRAPGA